MAKKKASPKNYYVQDYHNSLNQEDLAKAAELGEVWSEFGPTNVETTHGLDNNVSSNVAKIDARVSDLQRAAKLGRPTSVSGANIAKMGNMRVPHIDDYGAGVDLVEVNPGSTAAQEAFSKDVDRLEEFHSAIHNSKHRPEGNCPMCGDN